MPTRRWTLPTRRWCFSPRTPASPISRRSTPAVSRRTERRGERPSVSFLGSDLDFLHYIGCGQTTSDAPDAAPHCAWMPADGLANLLERVAVILEGLADRHVATAHVIRGQ